MSSIIEDLQRELLSADCDIVTAFRKAHFIAKKFKLTEFDKWLNNEMNGYKNIKDVPKYRIIRGILKSKNNYTRWIPVQMSAKSEKNLCYYEIKESISFLVGSCVCEDNVMMLNFSGDSLVELNRLCNTEMNQFALFFGINQIKSVIEKIRVSLLDWLIEIENIKDIGNSKNIKDYNNENSSKILNSDEFSNNITVIQNSQINSLQISNGDNNEQIFNYSFVEEQTKEVEKSINEENLEVEEKKKIEDILVEIKDSIAKKEKQSKLKKLFSALKDLLVSFGANVTAKLIEDNILGLI